MGPQQAKANTPRARKARPLNPFGEVKLATGEPILFLYPYDIAAKTRSGRHPGKVFGTGKPVSYGAGKFFEGQTEFARSAREMHEILVEKARERASIVVRGRRAHGLTFLRRIKAPEGNCPAGLADSAAGWTVWDCDEWPNAWKLDPRTQSAKLVRLIREVLGQEFEDARGSLQWSSSCCVGVPTRTAPESLSFRLWSWGRSGPNEEGFRSLCKRMDARVRTKLDLSDHVGWLVDPKVADFQQPVYLAEPRFTDGVQDPLQGRRWVWLEGKHDVLDLIGLAEVLPPEPAGQPWKKPKTSPEPKCPRERPAPKPWSTTVSIPAQPVPLAAASRELAAAREALAAKGAEAFKDKSVGFGRTRAVLEQVAIAVHRGGLQPGERDEMATLVAASVVATLPVKPALTADQVRAEIRADLRLCVSEAWIADYWEGNADTSIVNRYFEDVAKAAAGKLNSRNGRRYTYTMETLSLRWAPTDEECRVLGLRSLAPQRVVSAMTREAAGADKRATKLSQRAENMRRVHQAAADGLSLRRTVEATGIPLQTVRRLLKEPAPPLHPVAEVGETRLAA
jgi:hypothetical protein